MTVQPRPPEDSGPPASLTIEAPVGLSAIRTELEAGGAVDWETARELRNVSEEERERAIANATTTRANLAAQEAEATRPLTPDEVAQDYDLAKEEATRLGFETVADYLNAIRPIPDGRAVGGAPTEPDEGGTASPADDGNPDGAESTPAVDRFTLTDPPAKLPAHLTRQSLAAWNFARMAGDYVRFDHGRKAWMLWSGHRWVPDHIEQVNELWRRVLARRYELAMAIADGAVRDPAVKAIQDAGAADNAINGGLHIASSMPPLATAADAWDRDPYLLGCANGVVDLRTGLIRDGRPEDMISRSTGIVYDDAATCPRWLRFLSEDFDGDAELVEWFGLLIGASLIGQPMELLAIWYGGGNNGKSIAIAALRRAVGEYGVPIGVETLVDARRRAGAPTPDLMPLRGARLAFMTEPDRKAKLTGGALKRLASIDSLPGRELFAKQVSWTPTHTIHLATNHLPGADDASEGFWRRVALVPWSVHFRKAGESGDDPLEDRGLGAVLVSEASGILAWAVRGSVAILAGRPLWPFPVAVKAKTAAYQRDEDQLAAFITEQVVYELDAAVQRVELHRAYIAWCDAEQVPLGDRLKARAFGADFEAHGHVQRGTDGHERAIFRGARIRLEGDLWEEPEAPGTLVPGFAASIGVLSDSPVRIGLTPTGFPNPGTRGPDPDLSTNRPDGDSLAGRNGDENGSEAAVWLWGRPEAGDLEGDATVRLAASETIVVVPPPAAAAASDPTRGVECADYHAHQSRHRFTGTGWTCGVCHPASDGPETAP